VKWEKYCKLSAVFKLGVILKQKHIKMEELNSFLAHFNISKKDFESTGLVWDDLLKVMSDYEIFKQDLLPPAHYLIEAFHNVKSIHSVRFRIKNPTHLIEKIIRKRIEEPERIIGIDNYKTEITDLIGLRALHLFKEDWVNIHHFITGNWNLKETPIAYYRIGDSPEQIEIFKKYGCEVKEHPFGYRSVHYLVETNPNKNTYVSEVQVRTIFEEGWSEIDHKIRYPYDKDNQLLSQFLVMFNRLSGNADEMGSYVQYLKKELDNREKEHKNVVETKISIIEDLKKRIKELELKPKVALEWESELDRILKLPTYDISNFDLKLPDLSKFEFPDLSNIVIPDLSKFDFKLHDLSSFNLPNDEPKLKPIDKRKKKKDADDKDEKSTNA
jgi:ppGpp synthetase/RelA/SpoT-type nucleotidyltranferase